MFTRQSQFRMICKHLFNVCQIAILGLLLCLPEALHADDVEHPNVLLILADDLGYEKLGCYGGQDVPTPHLDKLAAEGVKCLRAYTSPVCTPSRMSLYTGRYTVQHGYYDVLPVHQGTKKFVDFSQRPTLPQLLRNAGYATSVTGKWQLAALEHHPQHVRSAGFDSWCVWQIWKQGEKTTRYWAPCFNHDGQVRTDIANRYGPDVLADYVIDQMRTARDAGQPFYVHHNMLLPHWPILPTPNEKASGEEPSLDHMISYMDDTVGRLLAAVDELGLRENTWVIFMGDNGTDSKEPRQTTFGNVTGGKHHLNDAGMHVPLILRGLGQFAAGGELPDLIDMTDLFPTICNLTSVRIPEDIPLNGLSFASRVKDPSTPTIRTYVTAGLGGDDCIFDGQWRLHRQGNELIDCRQLPREIPVKSDDEAALQSRVKLQTILERIAPAKNAR